MIYVKVLPGMPKPAVNPEEDLPGTFFQEQWGMEFVTMGDVEWNAFASNFEYGV